MKAQGCFSPWKTNSFPFGGVTVRGTPDPALLVPSAVTTSRLGWGAHKAVLGVTIKDKDLPGAGP